jgi:flagellar basal body-associated protein FliL
MKRKANKQKSKTRGGSLLVAAGVALFVLLLLMRMIAFVVGHGRHHY